jgi:serine phosphatase RsbU (regulator of sigma subunit)
LIAAQIAAPNTKRMLHFHFIRSDHRISRVVLITWLTILFIGSPLCIFSQDSTSILKQLDQAKAVRYKDSKQSIRIAYQALEDSKKTGYTYGIARSRYELAKAYFLLDDYTSSMEHITNSILLTEQLNDSVLSSDAYMALSNIYTIQNNTTQAHLYHRKSLAIKNKLGDSSSVADIINNIGYAFYRVKQYDSAMYYYRQSLSNSRIINYKRGISNTLQNIGHIYNDQQQNDSAEWYYRQSLPYSTELKDLQLCSKNYLKISTIFINAGNLDSAKVNLEKGLVYAREIGTSDVLCQFYKALSLLYEKQNDVTQAYHFSKLYYTALDSFNLAESSKKVGEMQLRFEMNRKDYEAQMKEADHKSTLERRNIYIGVAIAGLLILLIALAYIYRNYRNKSKANWLLAEQKVIIEKQKHTVEEKNKDITDSINYAQKIQMALLKEKQLIAGKFSDHFIFYEPKDIVAGDFYWAFEKDKCIYIAAGDCTGHGVPGAFLTMLGVSFLNEIVFSSDETIQPDEILNRLRTRFIKELSQTGESGENKDGMDISLASYNFSKRELTWAGANNPIWIITQAKPEEFLTRTRLAAETKTAFCSSSNKQLFEIKADKQPIGYHSTIQPFRNQFLQLNPGEAFYLFTDGFADQFGGPNGKKYKYQQLKDKLLSIHHLPFDKQREALQTEFVTWKGAYEQLDDVCVIGIGV